MKKLTIFLIVLAVLAGSAITYAYNAQKPVTAQNTSKQTIVKQDKYHTGAPDPQELLELVNKERAKVGVAPLKLDARLNRTAQMKADDMVKYKYFGHISPITGQHGYEYINHVGISCESDGENLFWGRASFTSYSAVSWWMGSKPHRDAMLSHANSLTGFGIASEKLVMHLCSV